MKLCKQTMINSYNWTSFSPERRGEDDFNYYTQLLKEDLETLGEDRGNYEQKFIDKVMTIFSRQARCASPMITGPANFNSRRNGKAWNSRDNAINEFSQWRKNYFKAVNRVRTLSPEEEIDKTLEELERMEEKQFHYKVINKLKKDLAKAKDYALENLENSEDALWMLNKYEVIPSFHLTNLNNKIKARKQKLDTMRNRIDKKDGFQKIDFNGGYVDIENDRVVIKHFAKPSKEVIEVIKRSGFRYSPRSISWVRKHTENAIYTAEKIIPLITIKEVEAIS